MDSWGLHTEEPRRLQPLTSPRPELWAQSRETLQKARVAERGQPAPPETGHGAPPQERVSRPPENPQEPGDGGLGGGGDLLPTATPAAAQPCANSGLVGGLLGRATREGQDVRLHHGWTSCCLEAGSECRWPRACQQHQSMPKPVTRLRTVTVTCHSHLQASLGGPLLV